MFLEMFETNEILAIQVGAQAAIEWWPAYQRHGVVP
jgi:hypothetical protein